MDHRPDSSEYPSFYGGYISLVEHDDLRSALIDSGTELVRMFGHHETNMTLADLRYAPGKWSVAEVLLHLVDSENVFLNRALWAARREQSELPGYDHDAWISRLDNRKWSVSNLIQWFRIQRQNTVMFYDFLESGEYDLTCTANNGKVSVRALGYIIAGHTRHHADILNERYLQKA